MRALRYCTKCLQTGHQSRDCRNYGGKVIVDTSAMLTAPDVLFNGYEVDERRSKVTCYKCRRLGHFASQCPENNANYASHQTTAQNNDDPFGDNWDDEPASRSPPKRSAPPPVKSKFTEESWDDDGPGQHASAAPPVPMDDENWDDEVAGPAPVQNQVWNKPPTSNIPTNSSVAADENWDDDNNDDNGPTAVPTNQPNPTTGDGWKDSAGGSGAGWDHAPRHSATDDGYRRNSNYSSERDSNRTRGGAASTCYNCGESGHFARECPAPRKESGRSAGGSCRNCGETGHFARDCPNQRKSSSRGDGSSRSCYNCGETGHFSRDCPKSGNDGGRSRGDRSDSRRSTSRFNDDRDRDRDRRGSSSGRYRGYDDTRRDRQSTRSRHSPRRNRDDWKDRSSSSRRPPSPRTAAEDEYWDDDAPQPAAVQQTSSAQVTTMAMEEESWDDDPVPTESQSAGLRQPSPQLTATTAAVAAASLESAGNDGDDERWDD